MGKGETAQGKRRSDLGMEEGAVRVAVHRLRKRYRQLLRDEISQTLTDPAQVDEEMRALFGAFRVQRVIHFILEAETFATQPSTDANSSLPYARMLFNPAK